MNKFEPYIFQDMDKQSETYLEWSIRLSESYSIDGYNNQRDAMYDLWKILTNKDIRNEQV
jgi:hypothetical protein